MPSFAGEVADRDDGSRRPTRMGVPQFFVGLGGPHDDVLTATVCYAMSLGNVTHTILGLAVDRIAEHFRER